MDEAPKPLACSRIVADAEEEDEDGGRGNRKDWAERRQHKSAIGRSMETAACMGSLCVV